MSLKCRSGLKLNPDSCKLPLTRRKSQSTRCQFTKWTLNTTLTSLEDEIHDRPNTSSKEPPFSHQSSDENVGGQRPGQTMHQSVVLIGDSIIKNIVPQKLTRKNVYKSTYPGRTVEEIDQEIQNKCSNTEA